MRARARLRIKREMSVEKPTVWIGKEGAIARVMDGLSKQLDKKGIVKVRVLQSALKNEEARSMAAEIAQETKSVLIDVRGHTFVFYKPRKRKQTKNTL